MIVTLGILVIKDGSNDLAKIAASPKNAGISVIFPAFNLISN